MLPCHIKVKNRSVSDNQWREESRRACRRYFGHVDWRAPPVVWLRRLLSSSILPSTLLHRSASHHLIFNSAQIRHLRTNPKWAQTAFLHSVTHVTKLKESSSHINMYYTPTQKWQRTLCWWWSSACCTSSACLFSLVRTFSSYSISMSYEKQDMLQQSSSSCHAWKKTWKRRS